jgi:hypothetical protein
MTDSLVAFDTKATSEEGQKLLLIKPDFSGFFVTADGQPWSITLRGQDSAAYRTAIVVMKRRIHEKTKADGELPQTVLDELLAEVFAKCVIDWFGISIEADGTALEFSEINARAVFIRFPWLLERVASFVETRSNFLPTDSSSSDHGSVGSSGSAEASPSQKGRKHRAGRGASTTSA